MVPRQVPANYKRPKDKIVQQAKELIDGFFRASNKYNKTFLFYFGYYYRQMILMNSVFSLLRYLKIWYRRTYSSNSQSSPGHRESRSLCVDLWRIRIWCPPCLAQCTSLHCTCAVVHVEGKVLNKTSLAFPSFMPKCKLSVEFRTRHRSSTLAMCSQPKKCSIVLSNTSFMPQIKADFVRQSPSFPLAQMGSTIFVYGTAN